MTIGTPLWDEFVANLKEVKVTIEDMGFMPDNFPCESDLKSMTDQQKVDIEQQFIEYYSVPMADLCGFLSLDKEMMHD